MKTLPILKKKKYMTHKAYQNQLVVCNTKVMHNQTYLIVLYGFLLLEGEKSIFFTSSNDKKNTKIIKRVGEF